MSFRDGWDEGPGEREGYDVGQVCLNGHKITSSLRLCAPELLPDESGTVLLMVRGDMYPGCRALLDSWEHCRLILRPVSQNHIGEPYLFGVYDDRGEAIQARHRMENEYNEHFRNKHPAK